VKIFIDTAEIDEIREAASWGILDGCTTNPSLVAKTGRKFETVLAEICEIVDGPISAEVISTKADGMIEEGRRLAKLHRNIVVKVPMITEGLKATRCLSEEGIRVNVTLIFQPAQALLAAKAGASYLSPFVGRLDDVLAHPRGHGVFLDHAHRGVVEAGRRQPAEALGHRFGVEGHIASLQGSVAANAWRHGHRVNPDNETPRLPQAGSGRGETSALMRANRGTNCSGA